LACTATGFTAGLATVAGLTGLAVALGAVLGAVLLGTVLEAAFEAVAFEPAAFAEVLAVLLGIALLLFFEDFAAVALAALRGSLREALLREALFREVLARLLVALRLAAAAFLEPLEALFLRVFCDTACARNRRAPVRCFTGTAGGRKPAQQDSVVECAYNSTFSVKINGLCPIPARVAAVDQPNHRLGLSRAPKA
jgi:hypothetical protein